MGDHPFFVGRDHQNIHGTVSGADAQIAAGIGFRVEHNAKLRDSICQQAKWQGIALDPEANARGDLRISAPDSAVDVLVIPTNEEWMIAHHAQTLLKL